MTDTREREIAEWLRAQVPIQSDTTRELWQGKQIAHIADRIEANDHMKED